MPFNADIAGQSSERDSKFRGKKNPPTDEEDNDSAEHEVTRNGFHLLPDFRLIQVLILPFKQTQ